MSVADEGDDFRVGAFCKRPLHEGRELTSQRQRSAIHPCIQQSRLVHLGGGFCPVAGVTGQQGQFY